jgi:hypothetical protein
MKQEASSPQPPSHARLKSGLRFGLFTSLITILVDIALQSMGLANFNDNSGGWFGTILVGLGIYLAADRYKILNNGFISQSDVVVTSLWLGFFTGIFSGIFLSIRLYLNPEIQAKLINLVEYQLEEKGIEGAEMEQIMSMVSMFFQPGFLAIATFISSIITALVIGFIMSFFLKKEKESPFA